MSDEWFIFKETEEQTSNDWSEDISKQESSSTVSAVREDELPFIKVNPIQRPAT